MLVCSDEETKWLQISSSEEIGKVRKKREGIFGNTGFTMAIQWLPELGEEEGGEGSVWLDQG